MQKTLIKDELATLRMLKRARRLIAKEENWTQGPYARTKRGTECSPWSKGAYSFCALGALQAVGVTHRAGGGGPFSELNAAVPRAAQLGPGPYNDRPDRKHSEVLRLYDRAIRTVERRIERMRARRARG